MRIFYFVIPYISFITIASLNIHAFKLEEEPQDSTISQTDSICSDSEKIVNLYDYYRKLRRNYCNPPEAPSFPKNSFHVFKKEVKGCKCKSVEKFVFLGNDYFPKELLSRTCLKTSCCNDTATECQEVTYKVSVLKMRKSGENEDHNLHPFLSQYWRSESYDVVAACVCLLLKGFYR